MFWTFVRDLRDDLPLVYNCALSYSVSHNNAMVLRKGLIAIGRYPYENIIWAPGVILVDSRFLYCLLIFPFHVIPALFFDALLRLSGKKPRWDPTFFDLNFEYSLTQKEMKSFNYVRKTMSSWLEGSDCCCVSPMFHLYILL